MSRLREGTAGVRPKEPGEARSGSRPRRGGGAGLAGTAAVFAALGDTTRIGVVERLCTDGPQSIARLSDGAGVTRQAITKHLETLMDAGLVRDARQGRARVFELEPKRLELARRELDRIADQWDAALGRLRAFVEEAG